MLRLDNPPSDSANLQRNFFNPLFLGLIYLPPLPYTFAKKSFSIEETFKTHCIECHGAKDKVKGDVDLTSYSEGADIKEDPELLQMILEVIDFGEMPPEENDPIPPIDQKVIVNEDVAVLKSIKGIGLKSAQRIIIDLKDKMHFDTTLVSQISDEDNSIKKEALYALEKLGFSIKKMQTVVEKIIYENSNFSVEEVIKVALKTM